jgi:hypothetical protein
MVILFLYVYVVTARPLTPQGNRIQSESPRPQLIHPSTQKPIAATQTGTQVSHEELYFNNLSLQVILFVSDTYTVLKIYNFLCPYLMLFMSDTNIPTSTFRSILKT